MFRVLRAVFWASAIASIANAENADGWRVYRHPTLHYSFRHQATMRVQAVKVNIAEGRQTDGVGVVFLGKSPLTFHWLEIYPVPADWSPDFGSGESDCSWSEVARTLAKPSARIYCRKDGAMGSTYRTLDYVIPIREGRLVIELVTRHLNDPEMQLNQSGEVAALDEDLSEDDQRREREKYEHAVAQSDKLLDQAFEQIVGGLKVR